MECNISVSTVETFDIEEEKHSQWLRTFSVHNTRTLKLKGWDAGKAFITTVRPQKHNTKISVSNTLFKLIFGVFYDKTPHGTFNNRAIMHN